MPHSISLEGQTAIVTGGAGGIGEATAAWLTKADANVTIFDIDEGAGGRVADAIDVDFVSCDMANEAAIHDAYNRVIQKRNKVDILVNNVGISLPGGILGMNRDNRALMEAVNVAGPFSLTELVMKGMIERGGGGCVTFVGSTQAEVIDGEPTIYNVQKNTILGLTKALAVAGGPFSIRVNCVSPGAIATAGMGAATDSNRERILATRPNIPLGRRGSPEEVAGVIGGLCSFTYVNGANIVVDGGFSIVAMPADYGPPIYREVPGDPDREFLRTE